jgi:hypothetical protein
MTILKKLSFLTLGFLSHYKVESSEKNLNHWSDHVQHAPIKKYLQLTYVGPGKFNPQAIEQFLISSGFSNHKISYNEFVPDDKKSYYKDYSLSFMTKNTQGVLLMSIHQQFLNDNCNINIFKKANITRDFFDYDVSKKLFNHLLNIDNVTEIFCVSRIPAHCLLTKITKNVIFS